MQQKNHQFIMYSDTHFGHEKLIKEGLRPSNFEERIIHGLHNIQNPENTTIIHLGDVAFYNTQYWHELFISSCPLAKHVLVLGNHDRKSLSWYYKCGWDFVCEEFSQKIYGMNVIFSHKPLDTDIRLDDNNTVNVHGHLHDGSHRDFNLTDAHYLVSMENWGYDSGIHLRLLLGK